MTDFRPCNIYQNYNQAKINHYAIQIAMLFLITNCTPSLLFRR